MIDYKIVAEQAAAANSRLADKVELLIAQRDELLAALKHAEYHTAFYSAQDMKNYLKMQITKHEAQL